MTSFNSLPLPPETQQNLQRLGYLEMTPIQAAALPGALLGKDLIAQARTGSGKTAAFALVLLANLNPRRFAVQALVLCPTRELADQVAAEIRRLAAATHNVKIITLVGGVALRGQRASLEHGAHVVVGTPGRVLDHLGRETLALDALNTLVLDEADRMLDMGFAEDIAQVAARCPKARQTLLFSATYPDGIAKLAERFMRAPERITVDLQPDATQVREIFFEVSDDARLHSVARLVLHFRPESTLAFCNTRHQCRDLVEVLRAQGVNALALHGELEQRERDQVLVQFTNRSCSVLVATDVAARGLDIAQLAAVVNVDMPADPDVYVHRIGRTGRAGESGLVLSLAGMDEMGRVGRIEQQTGRASTWQALATLTDAGGEPLQPPMVTLQLVGGRKDKVRAGDVLGALTGEAGFAKEQVGKIQIGEMSSYVAVAREIGDQAVERLNAGRIKGRKVKVRRLDG